MGKRTGRSMYISLGWSPGDVRAYYQDRGRYYAEKAQLTESSHLRSRYKRRSKTALSIANEGRFWEIILDDEMDRLARPA